MGKEIVVSSGTYPKYEIKCGEDWGVRHLVSLEDIKSDIHSPNNIWSNWSWSGLPVRQEDMGMHGQGCQAGNIIWACMGRVAAYGHVWAGPPLVQ